MISFKDFLIEKVTDNYLYHLVDIGKMKSFLKNDSFGIGETSDTELLKLIIEGIKLGNSILSTNE